MGSKTRVKPVRRQGRTWYRVLGPNGQQYGDFTSQGDAASQGAAVGRMLRRGAKSIFTGRSRGQRPG